MRAGRRPTPHRQSGAVLVIALLFLGVLTLLGISSMQMGTLEERMAGASRDQTVAFQAAEAALADAERDLMSQCAPSAQISPGANDCPHRTLRITPINGLSHFGASGGEGCGNTVSNRGLCLPPPNAGSDMGHYPPTADALLLDSATGVDLGTYTGATAIDADVARPPRYLIEGWCHRTSGGSLSGASCTEYLYRITAVGFGKHEKTQVKLQATFRRPL